MRRFALQQVTKVDQDHWAAQIVEHIPRNGDKPQYKRRQMYSIHKDYNYWRMYCDQELVCESPIRTTPEVLDAVDDLISELRVNSTFWT